LTFSVLHANWGSLKDVRAILTAAEEEGNARTISRPSLVTLNNEKSLIESLRVVRVPITTSTQITQTGASAVSSQTGGAVEAIEIGITLEVTPQVSNDGFILMEIMVKSSTLANVTSGDAVLPDELSRKAESKVLVRDGETIVIGGILKETRSEGEAGVPWLKEIPVFGWLFKQINQEVDFEELMVFITPRILIEPVLPPREERRWGAQNLPSAEELWRKAMRETEGDWRIIGPSPVNP